MQPLQRLYDSNGNEVCLFPLEYLRMSQGEHQLYAMDFLGWNSLGRVYDCPCYAPFSCEVVSTVGTGNNMICWSVSPVRFVDGTLDYATVLVAHSNTSAPAIGTSFVQGQLWYHTGNAGVSTGDHLHMEVARGHVRWDSTGTHLTNPYHLYDMMAVNNTVISLGMGYNWREYQGGVTPTPEDEGKAKRNKFPWAIYSRKMRLKMR